MKDIIDLSLHDKDGGPPYTTISQVIERFVGLEKRKRLYFRMDGDGRRQVEEIEALHGGRDGIYNCLGVHKDRGLMR